MSEVDNGASSCPDVPVLSVDTVSVCPLDIRTPDTFHWTNLIKSVHGKDTDMRLWKRTRKDTGQDTVPAVPVVQPDTVQAVRSDKDKRFWKRTRKDTAQPDSVPAGLSDTEKDLWWVQILLNVGRPVVAVFVLVMCAPGEHYLAREAGWTNALAWGMPGTLTAYAGIAAVVATKRPKDAQGRKTAVWGAIASITLAMAAQPIAHLYGRPGLTTQQVCLIVAVSCIPALVFGHLLHMAASGVRVRIADSNISRELMGLDIVPDLSGLDAAIRDTEDQLSRTSQMSRAVSAFNAEGTRTREEVMSEWTAARNSRTAPVSTDIFPSDDAATWTPEKDTDMSEMDTTVSGWTATDDGHGETVLVRDTPSVVQINRPGVPAVVRAVLTADRTATDKDIREAIRVQLGPDIGQNTIYKAITRTRDRMKIPAIKEA